MQTQTCIRPTIHAYAPYGELFKYLCQRKRKIIWTDKNMAQKEQDAEWFLVREKDCIPNELGEAYNRITITKTNINNQIWIGGLGRDNANINIINTEIKFTFTKNWFFHKRNHKSHADKSMELEIMKIEFSQKEKKTSKTALLSFCFDYSRSYFFSKELTLFFCRLFHYSKEMQR